MNPDEFYRRVFGIVDLGRLRDTKVAIVGLGSGGSRVAVELGRLGVSLFLFERANERLEEHNILRHVLGFGSLGKPKLSEMIGHLHGLNPATSVTGFGIDVAEESDKFARRLAQLRPDLIAVCTDNEPSKHAVNAAAVRLGIPQVGAGVYDGGIGGEIYRVSPGEACYGCIAAELQPHSHLPQGNPPNYNGQSNPEATTTCALNLDIEQIALLQTRMILDALRVTHEGAIGLPPDVNVWVFANRRVPGTFFTRPFYCEFFRLSKKADCLTCSGSPEDFDREAEKILSSLGP